jgi:hypothetical protein
VTSEVQVTLQAILQMTFSAILKAVAYVQGFMLTSAAAAITKDTAEVIYVSSGAPSAAGSMKSVCMAVIGVPCAT